MYKYNTLKIGHDIRQLCLVRLQESASCWYIEKQILYREITPHRAHNRFLFLNLRAREVKHCSQFIFCPPSFQFNLRNSCNTCQCFTTKAHGCQIEQIRCFMNLRCSMPFERQSSIRFRHSFAIIDYLHVCLTSVHHQYFDGFRTCINRIFHHFLHYG